MSTPAADKPLTLIVEESESGLLLESVKTSNKSTLNDHKTVVLDLNAGPHRDVIFIDVTRAGIDLNTILSLNLSHCSLNHFPDAFGDLNLQQLNLSHNKLESVPECIGNGLRSLEILDLSHNALGDFQNEPRCVQKLRLLRISNNNLRNIPEWILQVNCFNLEELSYSGNEINSLKKSRFRYKSPYRLKKLELKNCMVRSQDVEFLKDVRTLNVLDLSNEGGSRRNCFAKGDSFEKLFENALWDSRLKILCLNDLEISFLPEEIAKLFVLEELYLTHNDLLWVPDSLALLDKLRILDLSHNHITSLPRDLTNLANLEILKASYNLITNLPDFSTINLKVLDLYSNHLDSDFEFKIGSTITKIDLEQNFLDTSTLNLQDYLEMKNDLRSEMAEMDREDGPQEEKYNCEDYGTDLESTDSDWDCDKENACTFTEINEEESWSPKREACDNGCTSSDNEWMGSEKFRAVKRKKIRSESRKYPDWMFEDVS